MTDEQPEVDIDNLHLVVNKNVNRRGAWALFKFSVETLIKGSGTLSYSQMSINDIRNHQEAQGDTNG